VVLGSLAVLGGCGDGVTPVLDDFRFDGAAPDSATVLLLSADFRDDDGDLGTGLLETFIDDTPTSAGALDLLPIFVRSDLPVDATEGTLRFVLELSLGATPPPSGETFGLGARLTDADGNSSATRSIRLQLTY
jgi:hypothetical protein